MHQSLECAARASIEKGESHRATPGRTEHSTKDKTSVPFADGDNYSRNYSRRP